MALLPGSSDPSMPAPSNLDASVTPLASAVQQREFWLHLADGRRRFVRTWWPAGATVKAIMCIVPGLGDHSGRYAPLAMNLVASGMGVVSMDFQGHGLSPGWRGCIDSYEGLLDEVDSLVRLARGSKELSHRASDETALSDEPLTLAHWPQTGTLPVCLYGHSMGGNLVLSAVLRRGTLPDRLIASAPMLRAVRPPSPFVLRLARMLNRIAPHYRMQAPVRKELLSHVESEKEAYKNDVLMHRRVSLRLGAALLDSGDWLIQHAGSLTGPCLILHGSEDRVTDPRASEQFAASAIAAGAPCQLKIYSGMLHDLHRDQGKEQVIADIVAWALEPA